MNKYVALCGALVVACILTVLTPMMTPQSIEANVSKELDNDTAIIKQKVLTSTKEEQTNLVLYYKDQTLGVIRDASKLDALLTRVYTDRYSGKFPNTTLGLGEDVHAVSEVSFFQYEDKDDDIINYLDEQDLFTVETNKIEYSNGQVIYVKNIEDYHIAKEEFALNFIDKESYERIKNGQDLAGLDDYEYGTRIKYAGFKESETITKDFAPVVKIAEDKEGILEILSYGYEAEKKTYTTKEYDTVQGIAWLQDMSVEHLISSNKDKLVGENQLLSVGMELNVTAFNSPIHYEVVKENQIQEDVYPNETLIVYDDTLREGMEVIDTSQTLGSENAKYQETFVNGQSNGQGKKLSGIITKQPVREVKRVGTKIYPHIGSGHFRWPVEVVSVTCGWYCYSGHTATDVQNRYNHYGDVLASDRGTIIENSYSDFNGYYYVIDHNNGYTTYYGHMNVPGFFPVGTVVQQGEVIGQIGMTGFATGPHIHFEIRKDGVRLDPELVVGR